MKKEKLKSEKRLIGGWIIFWVVFWVLFATIYFSEFSDVRIKIKWPWKKALPVVEVQEKVYSPEEFVLYVADIANSNNYFSSFTVSMEGHESVGGTDEREAEVEPFKREWEFTELFPILKEFALTVVTQEGVEIPCYKCRYTDFSQDYKPGDEFTVLFGPKWIIYFDGKIYLVGQSGRLWHRRN